VNHLLIVLHGRNLASQLSKRLREVGIDNASSPADWGRTYDFADLGEISVVSDDECAS
jgi:hypothetical protein